MSEENGLSKVEGIKDTSEYLGGSIPDELLNEETFFSDDAIQLLKHHGSYQQDNRDVRKAKGPDGKPLGRQFSMMIRTRIPGGRVTADQFLTELDLGDLLGDGTVRLTTRQGFQLHGVLKSNLRETIRRINESKLTTLAACGDVSRNVMCCPAPFRNDSVRDEMQEMAYALAEHLKPRTTSYYDIWLRDDADPENVKANVTPEISNPVDPVEPMYGKTYLPRKFKIGIALPEDNCIDIHTQDLGFLAIVEDGTIIGYNVLVGGGMGVTPSNKNTFPAVGQKMAFIKPEQVLDVAVAVVKTQRDHGNRADRKQARMKYLIADKGLAWFKEHVEEHYGSALDEPHPADVTGTDDHMGWYEQGDGKWFLGLNVENGRVINYEGNGPQWKTALREIFKTYGMESRITALQGLILCDIATEDKEPINDILKKHNILQADELSIVRRYSMACPALPMCGLAVTESERVLPQIMDTIETRIAQYGLAKDCITIHMTGCPNGCARPYISDIGLVGKANKKYTVYLGGNPTGSRLNFIYKDLVPESKVAECLSPILQYYKQDRQGGEGFGDFCQRKGVDDLQRYAKELEAETSILDGEIESLTDEQLAELIKKFGDQLSAEQLQRSIDVGRERMSSNGSNGELQSAVEAADKRLDVFAS
ncbi:NADPH-dependent assimilatory sulfite reductase hemoprotein subunit [Calycomorphotria hydatis]|uniref:Sulfite reductase [ferredoxin] n=1 Tax=Calycomorphotria hydatis TaxID=2528027 RepID=A0A517T6H0_9PLAN|nr:NADPH-dependent assimilatory sulfite reductase hemoprotein subunit [Calycomorphotria hydatis]QDT63975.1 Sulfite reductase [ferredoxin] [Calycomorphotria hydatis]